MKKFRVVVEQEIEVTLDETKFTQEFMEEFQRGFFPFYSLAEHAEHIGQLQAREIIDLTGRLSEFVEGYGDSAEMGINTRIAAFDSYATEIPT